MEVYYSCLLNTHGWNPAAPEKKVVQGLGVDYGLIPCSITGPEKPVSPSVPSPSKLG